jgi:hypothetical protein
MTKNKIYLGDAVYADFDDNILILTTENGVETTNKIYLEPDVVYALINFWKKVFENDPE